MSQGNDFANYSASSNAAPGGSEEVWFVAVASDDIKQMTIDQLDEAFRLGVITGETPVWTEGMEAWSPLSQVADLDGDASAGDEPAPAASAGNSGTYGVANPGSYTGASSHGAASSNTGSHGAVASSGSFGGGFGAVTMQSVQHSFAPGPSSVAPVTSSYAPSPHLGHGPAPQIISSDDELPLPKRSGGFRPGRWALVGAAAAIAIGVVAYNNLSSSVASAGTEAAPAPTLAARPYEGADGVERGASHAASDRSAPDTAAAAPSGAEKAAADSAEAGRSSGSIAMGNAAAAAATTAKAALVAPSDDADEAPAKKGSDKESLRSTFSKSLTKKEKGAKASKVKPRKTASRASTKSRAKPKKSTVVRSQSAFDPLNDSLP